MSARSFCRRLGAGVVACAAGGVGLLTFAGVAHADSSMSVLQPVSCIAGSPDRLVNLSYSTTAAFTTGVRVHVVSGTPDGPTIDTLTVPLQGPVTVTIPFDLAGGTYYFDWEDRSGDGVTWSGRHSTLGDFYNGIFLATKTVVEPCVAEASTTTTTTTTTTIATTTTALSGTTTVVAPALPTTGPALPITATTAAVPTTAASAISALSVPTLPTIPRIVGPTSSTVPSRALGSTTVPPSVTDTMVPAGVETGRLLWAGSVFLVAGLVVTGIARRRPRRPA